jgi:hypothetical protein
MTMIFIRYLSFFTGGLLLSPQEARTGDLWSDIACSGCGSNDIRSRNQGNRMKIVFCRNNACKDSGQKGSGFPPAREQRSEYGIAGQQNIHSIALQAVQGRRI